jgi:hypothetical protein
MISTRFSLGFLVAALGLSSVGLGQARQGLDALSDDALMTELASRGLDDLLNRVFEQNKVPQEKRDSVRTLTALRKLSDPDSKLTTRQRQELIQSVTKGIESALPTIKDPRLLVQQANTLIQESINNDVNTLEYWGENPRLQASLQPIVESATKILDRALEVGNAELEKIGEQIKAPGDAAAKRFMEYESFIVTADFTRTMNEYARALAYDRANPERKKIATEAIEKLKEYDAEDSGVQAVVKNRIGKLLLARGEEEDFAAAKAEFAAVAEKKTTPEPNIGQVYEATYFAAVADLLGRKFDDAEKGLVALRAWQDANIPADNPQWKSGAEAAAAMLEYRITAARADAASGKQKEDLNNKANQILVALVKEQPALRGIIYQQLMDRLPPDTNVAKLDSLMLRALMRQGEQEAMKPEGEPQDAKVLERAIAASDEFVKRKEPGITNDDIATALLLRGVMLEATDKPLEAADAFLTFVEKFKGHPQAGFALDNSMALISPQLKDRQENAKIDALYTRVLGVAVAEPFNRVELAYLYGRQMQQAAKYVEAAAAYAKVPDTDANKLWARYFQMLALKQQLDQDRLKDPKDKTKLAAADARQMQEQIQQLAGQVREQSQKTMASAANDQERNRARQLLVQTTLMSADLANRVQNQPAKAIEILNGFEDAVQGMDRADQLLSQALFVRVDAFMDLKQNTKATDALVQLLETRGGNEGARMIYDLLTRLNDDFEAARKAGNKAEMTSLASARAELTGYLVKWAEQNKKDAVMQYRVYDAESQAQAARLMEDPARRTELLQAAKTRYEGLLAEGNDPVVQLGLANVAYDLGDYRTAQPIYTRLIADRKLGGPKRYNADNELVDNDQYWEAMYKLFKSNIEVAKADPQFANLAQETRQRLGQLYIMQGESVGGQRWGEEFQAMRKELLPDLKIGQPVEPDTPAAAATP